VVEPLVKYEFIRMPDFHRLGDYTETGSDSGRLTGEEGGYVHSMYSDGRRPDRGGRELWGFRKKMASPKSPPKTGLMVGTAFGRGSESRHHGLQESTLADHDAV